VQVVGTTDQGEQITRRGVDGDERRFETRFPDPSGTMYLITSHRQGTYPSIS
jgi:glutamine synthetase